MNVSNIYALAAHFKAQHLSPLQFAKPRNTGQPKATRGSAAPKPSGPQTAGDAHFDAVMARSADLLARTDPNKAKTPEGKAIIKDANRASGRDRGTLIAQDRKNVAGLQADLASHFDTAKAEIHRSHMSRVGKSPTFAPSAPAAPAPSAPAAPRKTMADFESAEAAHLDSLRRAKKSTPAPSAPADPAPSTTSFAPQKPSRKVTPEHLGSPRPAGSPATPASTPAPVKSAAQFPQKAPKKEDYRKAASPAPRPARTYHAPTPTPITPPAGQPAPKRSVSDSAWNAMLSDSIAEHKASKAKAAPTPAKPSVSDSDWDKMVGETVAATKAARARKAATKPDTPTARAVIRNGSPTASASSKSNVRETKLTVHGKEQVIRTEHNGTTAQLEAKHTKAVKAALAKAHQPEVPAAERSLDSATALGANKSTIASRKSELAQAKRKAAGYTHGDAFRNEVKRKPGKVRYTTEVPEHLKPFMGDGPDDPNISRYYGTGKK